MSLLTTTDGTTLFYKDWGTGKPVVFVHGTAMTSAFWEYIMLHLNSRGLRCIAYDQRGHGRSDDPGSGYDFDTLADDLHTPFLLTLSQMFSDDTRKGIENIV